MDNFEYFLLQRKGNQTYSFIDITDFKSEIMQIEIGEPKPRNPVMADYLNSSEIFFRKKVADKIKELDIDEIKLVATELTDPKGTIHDDYFCLLSENYIEAMDQEKSDFIYQFGIYSVKKYCFDRNALVELPLKDRLIFLPEESPEKMLFHRSVVDAIMTLNPTGMEFVNVETNEVL